MGIENREYMQDGPSYRIRRGDGTWNAVQVLIIANVVVFVLQLVFSRTMSFDEFKRATSHLGATQAELQEFYESARLNGQLPTSSLVTKWFALDTSAVLHGQIWRLTTYDFLHSTEDIWHLVFNMLLLYIAGRRVESYYGTDEFLAFYLVAGVLSGVVFMVWGLMTHTTGVAIGASGAAVAVMIVYAMHWPHEQWYIWGVIPVPVMILAIIAAAWDVLPMLRQLGGAGDLSGVAHSAHVGGMLFGLLYVHNRWRIMDWVATIGVSSLTNPFRRRPKLRVHRPQVEAPVRQEQIPQDVEARLDQLLEKITSSGEASLTDEERGFLAEMSRRYRNRH